jgi:hypothetical protein
MITNKLLIFWIRFQAVSLRNKMNYRFTSFGYKGQILDYVVQLQDSVKRPTSLSDVRELFNEWYFNQKKNPMVKEIYFAAFEDPRKPIEYKTFKL